MKRFSVYVKFNNDQDFQFETDTDITEIPAIHVDTGPVILLTKEQYGINLVHVRNLKVVEIESGIQVEFNSFQISAWIKYGQVHEKNDPDVQKQGEAYFNSIRHNT